MICSPKRNCNGPAWVLPGGEEGHRKRRASGCWLNDRAEYSHQPFRQRERAMANIRARVISAWLWIVLEGSRSSGRQDASLSARPRPLSILRNNTTPPSEDSRPPSNQTHISLSATGDKPGRKGIFLVMMGVGSSRVGDWIFHQKLIYINRLAYVAREIFRPAMNIAGS
jgi:hypothetical protein